MTSIADLRIVCPIGYALGLEAVDDGSIVGLDLAEVFEIGYLRGLAAMAAYPEWAMAKLHETDDYEGWKSATDDDVRAYPVAQGLGETNAD